MKRFVCILMTVATLMTFAAAESIDLDAMSFDEIVGLKKQIEMKLGDPIHPGEYIVGVDILAGSYALTVSDVYANSFTHGYYVYDENDELKTYEYANHIGDSVHVTLHDGERFVIESMSALVTVEEKKSWMP